MPRYILIIALLFFTYQVYADPVKKETPTPTPTPTPTLTPTPTPPPTPTPIPTHNIKGLVESGNGEINPTEAYVVHGQRKTFQIIPYSGNIINDVKLNSMSVYANIKINNSSKVGTYVWTSTTDANLIASFKPNPFPPVQVACITVGVGTCTATAPLPFTLYEGQYLYLIFTAGEGKTIDTITLNGTSIINLTKINLATTKATYRLNYSTGDKVFAVTFIDDPTPDMYVTATASNGSTTTPTTIIKEGKSRNLTFTANNGYVFDDLLSNGFSDKGRVSLNTAKTRASYQVIYAPQNKTITAIFVKDPTPPLNVICTVTGNGVCTPNTAIIKKDYTKTFTFTPNTGYRIGRVAINGVAVIPLISKTGIGKHTVKYLASNDPMTVSVTYIAK